MIAPLVLWFLCAILHPTNSNNLTDFKPPEIPELSRPYSVRLTKFLCVDQPYKYTEVHTCSVKLRRNHPASINLHFTFAKPTTTMHLAFSSNYKYTTYQPFIAQIDFDLCKFFAEDWGKGTNKLGDFLIDFATSQVDWIKQCPYYGRYNITNFEVRPSTMPNILPAGDYRADARHYDENNDTLMYFQIFFTVRAKGIFDLSG